MSQTDLDIKLNDLIKELRQLRIQNDAISNRIDKAINSIAELRTATPTRHQTIKKEDNSDSKGENRSLHKSGFCEGDIVVIKNPEKNRPNVGTVVGFTPTGFIRIDLGDGGRNPRRLPFNLRKHE